MPLLPRLKLPPRPPRPPSPVQKLRDIVKEGRHSIEKARDEIRSIAEEVRGGIIPQEPPPETKPEEECLPCAEMQNLKEYVARRKVERALSQLEKSGDKDSVETIKKYIEGEDVV